MKSLFIYVLVFLPLLSCGPILDEAIDPNIPDKTPIEETIENLPNTEGDNVVEDEEKGNNVDQDLKGIVKFLMNDDTVYVDNMDLTDIGNFARAQLTGDLKPESIYQLYIQSVLTTSSQRVIMSMLITDWDFYNLNVGDTIKQVKFENNDANVGFVGAAGSIGKETYQLSNDGLIENRTIQFNAETYKNGDSLTSDLKIIFTKIDHINKLISGTFLFTAYDVERDIYVKLDDGQFINLSY
ncbi:hypothetical protein [Cyclobacterium plantarum]|uniref:hypothetical protein n=1 Tax=Cyclobacterium plantarum TaxID=2716263 RepID=UPI003F729DB1